jgi:streptomycin 6-kinase
MWVDKCKERLTQVNFGDNHAPIVNYLMEASESIYKKTQPIATMHGDLHFGNILYNQQTNQITLIDPRGKYGAWEGTNGDNIYDFAKLAHDLFFGYNAMVSNVDHNKMVQKIFINKLKEYNLDYKTILKGGLLLLATCIPLHYDDKNRQDRFKKKVIEYVEKHCI